MKSPRDSQQLKILRNDLIGAEPKSVFESIKAATKQSTGIASLQRNVAQSLSLLLKTSVSVSVVLLEQVLEPQSLSNARDLHRYPQPSAVLEDTQYHYRIWTSPPPVFQSLDNFRKPFDKELKQVVGTYFASN